MSDQLKHECGIALVHLKKPLNYYNEKYLIKDRNGNVLKKSENLNQLIDKTSWNKLRLIK